MNHAHADGDRIERRAEAHFDAAQEDAPLVGRLQAVEDAHQGRFAGAVLAHDRVNLAAVDGEIDVIVGEDGAVTLDDADRFQLRDRQRLSAYLAVIGSATLIAPLTISSRSAFTLAIASG